MKKHSREFNGRLYTLHDTVIYKNEAIRKKEKLKSQGFYVRIIKSKSYGTKINYRSWLYEIWVSGNVKW